MSTEAVSAQTESPVQDRPFGLYRNLSFEDYYRDSGVRHGVLEGFIPPRTSAHGREAMLHPKEQTEALALGHAFHVCLLEPERFELEYVIAPKFDRRTNVGKQGWADFEAANKGKTLLDKDEHERYLAMREAVMGHPTARELLSGPGAQELSIIWEDKETGARCKARLDRVAPLAEWTFIVDLKSTRSAAERSFQKDIAVYGYARQGAWYRTGLNALRPQPRRFALIAVEKDPPYCAACWELDERALEQGERENRAALATLLHCQETGEWPGFDAGLGLLDLPAWAVDHLD